MFKYKNPGETKLKNKKSLIKIEVICAIPAQSKIMNYGKTIQTTHDFFPLTFYTKSITIMISERICITQLMNHYTLKVILNMNKIKFF